MKWISLEKAKDDGVYLIAFQDNTMGMLVQRNAKWYAKTKDGLIETDLTTCYKVCKIVRPK